VTPENKSAGAGFKTAGASFKSAAVRFSFAVAGFSLAGASLHLAAGANTFRVGIYGNRRRKTLRLNSVIKQKSSWLSASCANIGGVRLKGAARAPSKIKDT
jgi:hypothetical protein